MSEKTTYKIILIGDSAVGKTCIFKKITTGVFNEKSISTIGMDRRTLNFTIKDSEGRDLDVEVQLWDTAGQERFRTITNNYYKSSQGLLLIYDITKKDTFNNVENWINSIKETLGEEDKYLIVLIGNKVDLAEANPETREVSLDEAEEICKKDDIFWGGECSAKDFSEDKLKEIFTKYTQEIYKKVGVNIVKAGIVNKPDKPRKSRC
jgi:Ras-related protein Rab-1A